MDSAVNNLFATDYRPLFNGNISSMGVDIKALSHPLLYNYQYDQLNRLIASDAWNTTGSTWNNSAPINDFMERLSYDPNGNILGNKRNGNNAFRGSPLNMDSLQYHYLTGTNKLDHVTDSVGGSNYTDDIDNQNAGNYKYDSIGNLISDYAENINSIDWTVYGKIKEINKADGTKITYTYDPSGNRISKKVGKGSSNHYTWYVRDAQGNVLSTYSQGIDSINSGDLSQTELHLYGSTRLGIWQRRRNVEHLSADSVFSMALLGSGKGITFTRGEKLFELTNHLGNVLATVTDKKFGVSTDDSTVDHFIADVHNAQDYYAFGSLQPGRTYALNQGYRYGFNGKENDNEVKGVGNQQDYGMRIYDPRLGRFLSLDPISSDYPFYSPYQFAGNKPIVAADLDGMEEWMKTQSNLLERQAKLRVATMNQPRRVTVSPYNANDRTFAEKWRDSKNWFARVTYDAANGLYALPQQLTADVRQADYITNIGGNVYEARGIFGEKQRVKNFISAVTLFVPGAGEAQAAKGLAFSEDLMSLGIKASGEEVNTATKFLGTFDNLIQSGSRPDRNGLTQIGRALQKHAGREGSSFADIKFSHKTGDQQGLDILKEILNSKNQLIEDAGNGGKRIFDKSTGRGVGVSRSGEFNGFRDIKDPK